MGAAAIPPFQNPRITTRPATGAVVLAKLPKKFLKTLALTPIFVMLAMQYSWTDNYRMEMGVPGAQPKTGTLQ
jgi:hypothetical protein